MHNSTDKFLEDIERVINNKDISLKDKDEYIQTSFLAIILEHTNTAKAYCAAKKHINTLLAVFGNLLRAQLGIYKTHGATYKALVSVLNAGAEKITEIEAGGDEELPFDELIIKYGLADKHYPELAEALTQSQKGE